MPEYGAPQWRRVSPPYRTVARFSTGTLAEQTLGLPRHGMFSQGHKRRRRVSPPTGRWHDFLRAPWPSRRSALGMACFPKGTTVAKGLATLPQTMVRFPTDKTARTEARPPVRFSTGTTADRFGNPTALSSLTVSRRTACGTRFDAAVPDVDVRLQAEFWPAESRLLPDCERK